MENYKSKSPAGSFKIISLKQEKNSIKSRIVHKGKYNINLTELYLRTLDYFLSIKKSKKQQYPLSIKEGYENIKLINQIRKFHK
jgi:predicted  nucleic acid-binding Zn-ribbon protein